MEELYEYRRRLVERYHSVAAGLGVAYEMGSAAGSNKSVKASVSSPQGIAAHLLQVERSVFFPYLRKILDEELPCLEQTRTLPDTPGERDRGAPPATILEKFQQLRDQQVELLLDLPPSAWNRPGRHSTYGVRTLQWWVEHSLAHSMAHIERGGR